MKADWISCLAVVACWTVASAHTVITYPGWRGNNLRQTDEHPYGMQWSYPCGGMDKSTNRTKWPVNGGAIALQPGWFPGHQTAFMYVNLGLGTTPRNMSHPMLPIFQITGPSKEPYPGTICMPQVPLPANITVKVGDNATIQVVEAAIHGAALFNCVDITFSEPEEVAEVNSTNCFNSSNIGFNSVFATTSSSDAASLIRRSGHYLALAPMLLAYAAAVLS
ncbi:MAG: hypothetical protein M1833_002934 [Piccolia ochrophora]|nr:MAG: hypothetical protein M1833_002934 [Piccolia ochrophora]